MSEITSKPPIATAPIETPIAIATDSSPSERETLRRKKYVSGLRAVADWYESHPEILVPLDHVTVSNYHYTTKEDAQLVAKALGRCNKIFTGDLFELQKDLGEGTELHFIFLRSQICERQVVGTKVVPAHVIPAQPEVEVPEKIEEIVAWKCGPLLGED